MEKRLREDKWQGQVQVVNEGHSHDLHPDQWLQNKFSELLLWSTSLKREEGKENKKTLQSLLCNLPLHSLGQGIQSPAHLTDPIEGVHQWRSQCRTAGEENERCWAEGAERPGSWRWWVTPVRHLVCMQFIYGWWHHRLRAGLCISGADMWLSSPE